MIPTPSALLLLAALLPPQETGPPAPPAPAAPPASMPADTDPIRPSLRQIFVPPRVLGTRPGGAQISADGRYVLYRRAEKDAEEPERDVWLAPTAGGTPKRLFAAKPAVDATWTEAGSRLLAVREGWLELYDDPGSDQPPRPLMEVRSLSSPIYFFEDGQRIAFAAGKDNALWILDLDSGQRWAPAQELSDRSSWFQILEDKGQIALFASGARSTAPPAEAAAPATAPASQPSAEKRAQRVLHFVSLAAGTGAPAPIATDFAEGGRVEISKDGQFAVRTRQEQPSPRKLVMADYLTDSVSTVPVRSSLAGDQAAEVTIELYDVSGRCLLPPPLDQGENYWVANASFSTDGARLLVHRISNDFHVRQILVVDPAARSTRLVASERDAAWIGGPLDYAAWIEGKREILATSERSGFNHLYRIDAETGKSTCLTGEGGRFEVLRVAPIRGKNHVVVLTNEPDPAEQQLYAIDLDNGIRRQITGRPGVVANFDVSADGRTVAYDFEELGVPSEIYSASVETTADPVRLTDTIPAEYRALALPAPEIVEFTNAADGTRVRAFLYRPEPFDPARKYPCVVFIHGAGYLQNVTRSMTEYAVNMLFHHRLTRKGYAVLDVDYRHSAGYGRKFRTDVYGHLGGKDLDDVVAATEYLKGLGFVDGSRLGIYGGSYGGFLTLMALFKKPGLFAAGAALRSVTDWRTYNSWYSNSRLGDPKRDADNYARSSPIDHAEGLQDKLLILHGLKDSNVFAQDSIRLVEKLIQLGKDFDLMLYPSQDHGFTDPECWLDEYRRIEAWFDRFLAPVAPAPPADATH